MTRSSPVHALLGLAALAAVGAISKARGEESMKARLEAVAKRRIFFGHQSVGRNVIDGLEQLARTEGVPLRIVEGPRAGIDAATFAHAAMERNGDPMLKLRSFVGAFTSGAAAGADVALVKFCYVDVRADTDVAALFAAYRRAIAEAQAASPGTTFVHVTVPLQTVEDGVRGTVKRWLGRPLWGTNHNARREAYNELLRQEYAGRAPVFDLARVESTRPDGTTETAAWEGRDVRALVPAYTDDGGHLNQEGRLRAARELASVLAALPARAATATR